MLDCSSFNFFQEVDLWFALNTSLLHCSSQFIGFSKIFSTFQIFKLGKSHQVVWILCSAKYRRNFSTQVLKHTLIDTFIIQWFPLVIVLYFMINQNISQFKTLLLSNFLFIHLSDLKFHEGGFNLLRCIFYDLQLLHFVICYF